jgi:uncharacterized membrane protein
MQSRTNTRQPSALWPALGVILSQALDFVSTMIGLKLGGSEQNVLVAFFINNWGAVGFLAYKFCGTLFIVYMIRGRQTANWLVASLYCGVTLSNLWVVYQLLP